MNKKNCEMNNMRNYRKNYLKKQRKHNNQKKLGEAKKLRKN